MVIKSHSLPLFANSNDKKDQKIVIPIPNSTTESLTFSMLVRTGITREARKTSEKLLHIFESDLNIDLLANIVFQILTVRNKTSVAYKLQKL